MQIWPRLACNIETKCARETCPRSYFIVLHVARIFQQYSGGLDLSTAAEQPAEHSICLNGAIVFSLDVYTVYAESAEPLVLWVKSKGKSQL
jgi:hypothetical protein